MDETRVDLSLDQSASESLSTNQVEQSLSITVSAPQQGTTSSNSESVAVVMDIGEGISSQVTTKDSADQKEAIAGPSSECLVPEVINTADACQNGN